MAADLNPIPGYNKDGEDSVWAFRNSQSGVKQLVAGSGITLSPASGLGAVTVTSSGGGGSGTVTSVAASGSNIVIGGTPTIAPTVALSANPSVTTLTTTSDLIIGGNVTVPNNALISSPGTFELKANAFGSADKILLTAGAVQCRATLDMYGQQVSETGTVTFSPGTSKLTPYVVGSGGAARNYLDVTAPATIGANVGALRLLGTTGTVALTISNTIDLTNIDTLNGHQLYAYATFQTTPGVSTNIPVTTVVLAPLTTTIVNSGPFTLNTSTYSISSSKTGDYRFISNISLNNFAAVDGYCSIFLRDLNAGTTVVQTIRTVLVPVGYSTHTFCCTLPAYAVGRDYALGFYQTDALNRFNIQIADSGLAAVDLNIELMG
jgi:hypothetical protein